MAIAILVRTSQHESCSHEAPLRVRVIAQSPPPLRPISVPVDSHMQASMQICQKPASSHSIANTVDPARFERSDVSGTPHVAKLLACSTPNKSELTSVLDLAFDVSGGVLERLLGPRYIVLGETRIVREAIILLFSSPRSSRSKPKVHAKEWCDDIRGVYHLR